MRSDGVIHQLTHYQCLMRRMSYCCNLSIAFNVQVFWLPPLPILCRAEYVRYAAGIPHTEFVWYSMYLFAITFLPQCMEGDRQLRRPIGEEGVERMKLRLCVLVIFMSWERTRPIRAMTSEHYWEAGNRVNCRSGSAVLIVLLFSLIFALANGFPESGGWQERTLAKESASHRCLAFIHTPACSSCTT